MKSRFGFSIISIVLSLAVLAGVLYVLAQKMSSQKPLASEQSTSKIDLPDDIKNAAPMEMPEMLDKKIKADQAQREKALKCAGDPSLEECSAK